MGWYPLIDDEHLNFPEELREKVRKVRLKSRSKHKAHDEDEYEWAVYWCEYFGPRRKEDEGGHAFVSLAQRWKLRRQSKWSVLVPGPHTSDPEENYPKGYQYWKSIDEFLGSVGLTCERERFRWHY